MLLVNKGPSETIRGFLYYFSSRIKKGDTLFFWYPLRNFPMCDAYHIREKIFEPPVFSLPPQGRETTQEKTRITGKAHRAGADAKTTAGEGCTYALCEDRRPSAPLLLPSQAALLHSTPRTAMPTDPALSSLPLGQLLPSLSLAGAYLRRTASLRCKAKQLHTACPAPTARASFRRRSLLLCCS